MKKSFKISFTLLFLVGFVILAGAQSLDQPVAVIKLTKTTIIGQKVFREKVSMFEKSTGRTMETADKQKLLDSLILQELILQGAEKQGIRVTDDELMRQLHSDNPGAPSDEAIKNAAVQQYGKSWVEISKSMKEQITVQQYFMANPKAKSLEANTKVSDKEVTDFYESNKTKFVQPDMMRYSHIFFDTKKNPKGTVEEIKKRAEEIQKKIASGQVTFEEMVRKESEDRPTAANNGDMGFLPRTLDSKAGQTIIQRFGKDFLDSIYSLKKGELSKVLVSNVGIHIVKMTDKIDQHFQTLDEDIYPDTPPTVKEYIRQGLLKQKMGVAQEALYEEIGNELKKTADVKSFPQNM